MDDVPHNLRASRAASSSAYFVEDRAMRSLLWLDMLRAYLNRADALPEGIDSQCFDLLIALDIAQFEGRRLYTDDIATAARLPAAKTCPRLALLETARLIARQPDPDAPERCLITLTPDGLAQMKLAYRRFFGVLEAFSA